MPTLTLLRRMLLTPCLLLMTAAISATAMADGPADQPPKLHTFLKVFGLEYAVDPSRALAALGEPLYVSTDVPGRDGVAVTTYSYTFAKVKVNSRKEVVAIEVYPPEAIEGGLKSLPPALKHDPAFRLYGLSEEKLIAALGRPSRSRESRGVHQWVYPVNTGRMLLRVTVNESGKEVTGVTVRWM